MTPATYDLIKRLNGCTFLPGSFEKGFVRGLAAKSLDDTLTEKQLMLLGQIRYRYRKQLHEDNDNGPTT
jgi:hypothetical protein